MLEERPAGPNDGQVEKIPAPRHSRATILRSVNEHAGGEKTHQKGQCPLH
jgi:hypothetical protein